MSRCSDGLLSWAMTGQGRSAEVRYPRCQVPTVRVHGRYRRRPEEFPGSGPGARLIEGRRFHCRNPVCCRRTVASVFPGVAPLQRYTLGSHALLWFVGLAPGGMARARLSDGWAPTSVARPFGVSREARRLWDHPARYRYLEQSRSMRGRSTHPAVRNNRGRLQQAQANWPAWCSGYFHGGNLANNCGPMGSFRPHAPSGGCRIKPLRIHGCHTPAANTGERAFLQPILSDALSSSIAGACCASLRVPPQGGPSPRQRGMIRGDAHAYQHGTS